MVNIYEYIWPKVPKTPECCETLLWEPQILQNMGDDIDDKEPYNFYSLPDIARMMEGSCSRNTRNRDYKL